MPQLYSTLQLLLVHSSTNLGRSVLRQVTEKLSLVYLLCDSRITAVIVQRNNETGQNTDKYVRIENDLEHSVKGHMKYRNN